MHFQVTQPHIPTLFTLWMLSLHPRVDSSIRALCDENYAVDGGNVENGGLQAKAVAVLADCFEKCVRRVHL